MSKIITFYSYKGGVGRSMSLANIGACLSIWGYRILIIDWDLEAPGLEHYFDKYIKTKKVSNVPGVIDILNGLAGKDRNNIVWQDCIVPFSIEKNLEPIHLITSGRDTESYSKRLKDFDVDDFYQKSDGAIKIENLRNEWLENYDFVLIDSRTGLTDFGGMCTIHLPDILLLFYTPARQSIDGTVKVAGKAVESQVNIPFDRERLITFPIPTRVDTQTEFDISQKWMNEIREKTMHLFGDWVPASINLKDFIEQIKIPYTPYFSYGEEVAVLVQGTSDPVSMGFAYETISAIIANEFQGISNIIDNRGGYINEAKKTSRFKPKRDRYFQVYLLYAVKDFSKFSGLKHQFSIFETKYDLNVWEDSFFDNSNFLSEKSRKVIARSDMFVLFLTKNFVESNYALEELDTIYNIKKDALILPVLIEEVDLNLLSLFDVELISNEGISFVASKNKRIAYKNILSSIDKYIEIEINRKRRKDKENIWEKEKKWQNDIIDTRYLRKLIAEGEIGRAIDILKSNIEEGNVSDKIYDELILLVSQYNRINKMTYTGVLSHIDADLGTNRIVKSLLNLLYLIEYDK